MIIITEHLSISEEDIAIEYVQASGPGGQNVNKVATTAQLRFNINTPSLPEEVRLRLVLAAGKRISQDGELLIQARRYRTQEQNRQDAVQRLVALLRKAAEAPRPRRPTRPTAESKRRRLEEKRQRAETKQRRRERFSEE